MKENNVRVRIAPSPTGFAHIGTAYTALFNYAFAKKRGGKFIVRVEDTDVARNVKGAEDAIFEGLTWLGISHDESVKKPGSVGPYRQSEKLEKYATIAKDLVKAGLAYEDDGAIRYKNKGEDIFWIDLIKGKITFPGDQITDFVIQKSDGYPTYNFAVVVDDLDMKITHVIRGEDHVSNTPRQLAIYKALKKEPPKFAHHPTIRNKEHKKLSKRHDNVDIMFYKKQGYLPEALVNFLSLLGWSHPKEKEIFDLSEFVELFSLKRVRSAGPVFDTEKLDWMNKQYLGKMSDEEFVEYIGAFSKYAKNKDFKNLSLKTASLVRPRISKSVEYDKMAGYLYEDPKVDKKLFGGNYKNHIKVALASLKAVEKWTEESITKALLESIDKKGFGTGKFFADLRVAITGSRVSPPLNETMAKMKKEIIIKRLEKLS